ncbi:hypothetical protein B0J14DRAFT_645980 [Halenospora varia]|nr:hypothetical protein B0J14DRAFT_645980 [Halenospora varia]
MECGTACAVVLGFPAFGVDPRRIVLSGHSSSSVHTRPKKWLAGVIKMPATSHRDQATHPRVSPPYGKGKWQLKFLCEVSICYLKIGSFNATTNTWFTPVFDGKTGWSVAEYAQRYASGL